MILAVLCGSGPLYAASSSGSAPLGYLDHACGGATGTDVVYQSDVLSVSGWAADWNDNGPAKSISVLIDGSAVGNATLAGARPDVAAAYGNPAWMQSGWSLSFSASSLSLGTHTVTALAADSIGLTTTLGPISINVRSPTPIGYLDRAVGSATQTSLVYQSDTLSVSGWAADYNDNAPARGVQILIDGVVSGSATLGESRPDVAAGYNNPAWTKSGWSFSMSASNLSVGTHLVAIVASDSLGISNKFGTASFTVLSNTPIGYIDAVTDSLTQGSTLYQSDALTVVGWAADYNDNAPAHPVQVLIDGLVAGSATLGGNRPDVATAYNNPAWNQSGWIFSINAASLSVGNHQVSAVAGDSLGLSNALKPITISVLPKMTATLQSSIAVKQGATATGTITLSYAAPLGGATFALTTDSTAVATAPPSVTVPEGATAASFTLVGVQAGSTVLRATAANHSASTSMVVVSAATAQVIKHVVVIFDENVSFDHYFGTYPNATNPPGEPAFTAASATPIPAGLSGTLLTANPNALNPINGAAAVSPFRLDRSQAATADQDHGYTAEQLAFHDGAMDQFPYSVGTADSAALANQTGAPAILSTNALTMGYFDGNTVTALWNYAQHYTLSDHFFATNFGPSTPGAINLIAGQTNGVVNDAGASASVIPDGNSGYTLISDPDPTGDLCANASNSVHMTGKNVGDLLTQAGVSWGWFAGGFDLTMTNPNGSTGCGRATLSRVTQVTTADYQAHHQPFQYYASTANPNHVRPRSALAIGTNSDAANHQYDLHDFFDALSAGNMPEVSFLKPPGYEEAHAGYSDPLDEQTFLVNAINTIEQSSFWQSTAIVIAYDDSDGWYDHIMNLVNASQTLTDGLAGAGNCSSSTATQATTLPGVNSATTHAQGRCGYGPRLPLLLISPWAKTNAVDPTVLDQTSITRLIEDTFLSGQRIGGGSFDGRANAMDPLFDLAHTTPPNSSVIIDPSTGLVTRP
jgi:phospholipase C